jgi:hypothetical protein
LKLEGIKVMILIFQGNVGAKSEDGNLHLEKNVNSGSSGEAANQFLKANNPSSPPESVFVRLTPSRQRYSFRDEL